MVAKVLDCGVKVLIGDFTFLHGFFADAVLQMVTNQGIAM